MNTISYVSSDGKTRTANAKILNDGEVEIRVDGMKFDFLKKTLDTSGKRSDVPAGRELAIFNEGALILFSSTYNFEIPSSNPVSQDLSSMTIGAGKAYLSSMSQATPKMEGPSP